MTRVTLAVQIVYLPYLRKTKNKNLEYEVSI